MLTNGPLVDDRDSVCSNACREVFTSDRSVVVIQSIDIFTTDVRGPLPPKFSILPGRANISATPLKLGRRMVLHLQTFMFSVLVVALGIYWGRLS